MKFITIVVKLYPHSLDELTNLLDKLTEDAKQRFPVAIAGDFNAWAVDWNGKETIARGYTLLKAMSALGVVLPISRLLLEEMRI